MKLSANSISNHSLKTYTPIGLEKPTAIGGIVAPWARASVQRILAPKRAEM